MRFAKNFMRVLGILLLGGALGAQGTPANPLRAVGVMELQINNLPPEENALVLKDLIFNAVANHKKAGFIPIAQEVREDLLSEIEFAQSGVGETPGGALRVGRYLSAQFMITGSFTKSSGSYFLILQLIDVETTRIVAGSQDKISSLDRLDTSVQRCVAGLFQKFLETADPPAPSAVLAPPAKALALPSLVPQVLVPGGQFVMGTDFGSVEEKPAHKVVLRSFHLSRYEITEEEFALFRVATGRSAPDQGKPAGRLAAVNVKWIEAVEFCNWLSREEGLTPVYEISRGQVAWDARKNGYRLPTEAEWEYASGAAFAAPTPQQTVRLADRAWYADNAETKRHPVGLKAPNALGLHDLFGNVWEWCWDFYRGKYDAATADNPAGPREGRSRTIRGGAWNSSADFLRLTARGFLRPDESNDYVGFRIARNSD